MTTAADVLAARGMQRAPEVVEIAATVDIELAIAATMLQRESWGRNVWGHDRVQTAGIYVMGAEVTRDAYLRYKAVRRTIGNQGVGPAQLTSADLQDRADAAGGCWDWRTNLTVGLQVLSERIRAYGLWGGFKAYNGAASYADGAMQQLAIWREQLAAAAKPIPPRPREEDAMYVKCGNAVAILSGPIFVGLASPSEIRSAEDAIARGATVQWVERYTWDELDRRSKVATT